MGAHAYVVSNFALGTSSGFTWSNGATANRSFLTDGYMDQRMLVDAAAASGISLVMDFGSGATLIGCAVLNSNCAVQKTNAALRVRAADDAAITVNVVTAKAASTLYSATAPRNKDHVLQWASIGSKRYWQLTWTWTGTVTNFSIGEIFAFQASTQLSRRSIYGSGERKRIKKADTEMQYGETRSLFQAGPLRELHLLWEDVTASERDQLDTMWSSSLGGAHSMLWIDSYEAVATAAAVAEQQCCFGKLREPDFEWSEQDFQLYTPAGFTLGSLAREAGA